MASKDSDLDSMDLAALAEQKRSNKVLSKILIIERDAEMRDLIAAQLPNSEYKIQQSGSGLEALKEIERSPFDLVIADWTLPELSCLDFIKKIREKHSQADLAILVLTSDAREEVQAKIIEVGATDYLMKPFDRAGLQTRVKSISRRLKKDDEKMALETGRLILGDVTLDTRSFDVYCAGARIHLTPSEFKLLHALAVKRGTVMTRESLIQLVQGVGIAVIDRAVDTHIFSLRKKLGSCSEVVETVRGFGYRIRA